MAVAATARRVKATMIARQYTRKLGILGIQRIGLNPMF